MDQPRMRPIALTVVALVLVLVALVGCARDVRVRYPAASDESTGTLVLLLSQAADDVNVAINGTLVVEDAHTSRITVTSAPAGGADIVLTANGSDKAMHVWIGSGGTTTIPLGVPDGSMGLLKTVFGTLVTMFAYSLLH